MNKQVVGLKIEGKNQSAIKIDPEMSLKEFRSQYLKDNPAYYFKSNYGLEIQRQSQRDFKIVQIITKRYKYVGTGLINVFIDSKYQHKTEEKKKQFTFSFFVDDDQTKIGKCPDQTLAEFRKSYCKEQNKDHHFLDSQSKQINHKSETKYTLSELLQKNNTLKMKKSKKKIQQQKLAEHESIKMKHVQYHKQLKERLQKKQKQISAHQTANKLQKKGLQYQKELDAVALKKTPEIDLKSHQKILEQIQAITKQVQIVDRYFNHFLQSKDVSLQDIIRNNGSVLVTFDLHGKSNQYKGEMVDLHNSIYTFANQKLNSRTLEKITYSSQQAETFAKLLSKVKQYSETAVGVEMGYGPVIVNSAVDSYDALLSKKTVLKKDINKNEVTTKWFYQIHNNICIKYTRDSIALSSKTLENFKKILPLVSNNQLLRKGVYQFLEQIAYVEVGYYKFGGIYRFRSQIRFDQQINQILASQILLEEQNRCIEGGMKVGSSFTATTVHVKNQQKGHAKKGQATKNQINYYANCQYDIYPNIKKRQLWSEIIDMTNKYWKITEKDEIRYFKISSILKNDINKQMLNIKDQILNQVCEVIDEIILKQQMIQKEKKQMKQLKNQPKVENNNTQIPSNYSTYYMYQSQPESSGNGGLIDFEWADDYGGGDYW